MNQKIITGALLCLVLAGCTGSSDDERFPEGVVALVDQESVTVEELTREMERRRPTAPDGFADPRERRELLEELIDFDVAYLKAIEAGYDRDPKIVEEVRRLIVGRFRADRLGARTAELVVTDEDVRAHYEANAEKYAVPARSRGALIHIEVPSRASPEKVRELEDVAKRARAEAARLDPAVSHFGDVARKYSDDRATRYTGGDIGWLEEGKSYRWPSAVVEAVFALAAPGELSPVIRTAQGCTIVKLSARRAAGVRPLEEVAPTIRNQLAATRKRDVERAFADALRAKSRIRINTELLEAVPPPGSSQVQTREPPGISAPGK